MSFVLGPALPDQGADAKFCFDGDILGSACDVDDVGMERVHAFEEQDGEKVGEVVHL